MAINHYFEVFSNDGSTTLFTTANTVNGDTIITVTETGLTIGTETYTYSGTKKFVGVSFSENSTSPELAIGESFDGNTAYAYIVEAEPTASGVTVEYNGSVVATIENGNKATLPIKDLKMKSDIVIIVPEAEGGTDSPLPIEVSTAADMTALLESGEVGGVYKYTGTTGTYENGALYVLEEETGFTVKLVGQADSGYGYYSVNGGEDIQIADANYVSKYTTMTKDLADSKCITLTDVTSLICMMSSADVTYVNIKDSNFNDIEAELYGYDDGYDNYNQVLDVTSYLTEGCYVILWTDD